MKRKSCISLMAGAFFLVFSACTKGGSKDGGASSVGTFGEAMNYYFEAVEALSKDKIEGAKKGFERFQKDIRSLKNLEEDQTLSSLLNHLDAIREAEAIYDVRKHLQPISYATFLLLEKEGKLDENIHCYMCTMVPPEIGTGPTKEDGYWLSRKAVIENPYRGSTMFNCGVSVERIEE